MAKSKPIDPIPLPPLEAKPTAEFKKDVKRQKKRGKDVGKLRPVIEELCRRRPLDQKYQDHALTGEWEGWRDRHVQPDWILVYKMQADTLILGRTGTHSDLGF